MTIQIKRNNAGNCITFVGSSKPVYFNSCLSGRVNPDDSSRIDIINDINTTDVNNPAFEFFAVDYTLFRDADNNSFATAQDAADYVTAQGNTIGNTGTFELQDHNSLSFTKTSDGLTILVDNGDAHALETLSARVDQNDNTKLEITNHTASRSLYSNISPNNVLYNNDLLLTGSLNDMVNQLNAYFNGQPLQTAISEGTTTLLSGGEFVTVWYIENTPGYYSYPLFKNSEDADLVAEDLGNSGHTSIVFPNDPANTTWYLPTGGSTSVNTDPTGLVYTIDGKSPNWNEQTAQYPAPTAFADTTVTVDELSAINVQIEPAGATWTTAISNLDGSTFALVNGTNINGNAPEVLQDNVANPYDDYRVSITRTNSYGTSTGTLTIRVTNLTAPIVQPINGFTWEPTSTALSVNDELNDGSVVSLDDTVPTGRRFIMTQAWVEANVLPNLNEANDFVILGIKDGSPTWGSLDIGDFDVHIKWEWASSTSHTSTLGKDGVNINTSTVASLTDSYYDYAIEVDGTDVHAIACNFNDINTQHSVNDGGAFSRVITRANMPTGTHTIYIGAKNTTADLSVTGLSEIDIPATPVTHLTSWDKAIDFSGGEYAKHVNNSMFYQPLQMNGLANTVPGHSTPGYTSNNSSSRPWATVVVFKSDGYSGNQMIWNQGEGSVSGNDNIFVNVTANGTVNFGWGREGVGYNQCQILTNISSSTWYAVYIAHSGERLGGNNATASNLADCFDIRTMSSADSFASLSSNLSVTANWVNTGVRMDRTVAGDFTVGGRGTGYSYRGKVASMITHCLKAGVLMPNATEIKLMITDPLKWEADYLIGNSYRRPAYASSSTNYQKQTSLGFQANQMWLMGDGTPDVYPNINNEQRPNWINYTYLVMTSMVSNDIENVSINGLS